MKPQVIPLAIGALCVVITFCGLFLWDDEPIGYRIGYFAFFLVCEVLGLMAAGYIKYKRK